MSYSPLSERTVEDKTLEAPYGRPSVLVARAQQEGLLEQVGCSILDEKVILAATEVTQSVSLEENKEWTESDTKEAMMKMMDKLGHDRVEAGKQNTYITDKKSKPDNQTIKQEHVIPKAKGAMPFSPKVEETKKEKKKKRKGKHQQRERNKTNQEWR